MYYYIIFHNQIEFGLHIDHRLVCSQSIYCIIISKYEYPILLEIAARKKWSHLWDTPLTRLTVLQNPRQVSQCRAKPAHVQNISLQHEIGANYF